jgi:hypothetical protein
LKLCSTNLTCIESILNQKVLPKNVSRTAAATAAATTTTTTTTTTTIIIIIIII